MSRDNGVVQVIEEDCPKTHLRGIDELNLAELPIATLGRSNRATIRTEQENTLTFKFRDAEGKTVTWEVTAGRYGLPTEFAERVLVILMALANKQGYSEKRLYFTVYEILQILELSINSENYKRVDLALKQLTGTTIYSNGSFVDKVTGEKVYDASGFGILEYKLTYRETTTGGVIERQRNPTYIDWGERFFENFKRKHTKPLDLDFYLSLKSAIARRLYRILDYKLYSRQSWYRDIFEVSSRVGLARYDMPARVKRKLKPGADELVEKGFLEKWETKRRKHKGKWYTHIIFYKHPDWKPSYEQPQEQENLFQGEIDPNARREAEAAKELAQYAEYGTTQAELDLWHEVLLTLRRQMTQATFDVVLANSMLLSFQDGCATIGLHNDNAHEWAENRLSEVIQRALKSHVENGNGTLELEFVTMP